MDIVQMKNSLTDTNAGQRTCWDETVSVRLQDGRMLLHFEEFPKDDEPFEEAPASPINDDVADADAKDWILVPRR